MESNGLDLDHARYFVKDDFEKNQQTAKKHEKLPNILYNELNTLTVR